MSRRRASIRRFLRQRSLRGRGHALLILPIAAALVGGAEEIRSVRNVSYSIEHVQRVGLTISDRDLHDFGGGVWLRHVIERPSEFDGYIRVRIRIESTGRSDFALVFLGRGMTEVARYHASMLVPATAFTSPAIESSEVYVRLEAPTRPRDIELTIEQYAFEKPPREIASSASAVRSIPISERSVPETARQVADATARILLPGGIPCSGFLIRADLVLTNFHCVRESDDFSRTREESRVACEDIEVRFDYDGETEAQRGIATPCLEIVRFREGHDYAVLRIDPERIRQAGRQRAPVRIAWTQLPSSTVAVVVGHPLGLPKSATPACTVYSAVDTSEFPATDCDLASDGGDRPYLQHDCQTWPGSSGSPVIASGDGRVVALHYCGEFDPARVTPEQLQALHQGMRWRNRAVNLSRLRDDLKDLVDTHP